MNTIQTSLVFIIFIGGMLSTYVPLVKKASIFSVEVQYRINFYSLNCVILDKYINVIRELKILRRKFYIAPA